MSVDVTPFGSYRPMGGEATAKLGLRMAKLREQRETIREEWEEGDEFTVVMDGVKREGKFVELVLDGSCWIVKCTWTNKGVGRWGTGIGMQRFYEEAKRKG